MHAITFLRKHNHLSREQLAVETGLNVADLVKMEHGNIRMPIVKYQKIADYFHVEIDPLLRNEFQQIARNLAMRDAATPQKTKYDIEQARRCRTGKFGEILAYSAEVARHQNDGYAALVDPTPALRTNVGYDLFSFNDCGEPVMIEVKSTESGMDTPFFFTAPEFRRAQEAVARGEHYCIYRYSYVHDDSRRELRIIPAEEFLKDYSFVPVVYRIGFKKEAA
jgi:transcriptional regulator with XRE-family HTH domain